MSGEEAKIARSVRQGPSLGEIESRVGYLLHRTDMLHMDVMSQCLAELSLTPARATAMTFIKQNAGAEQAALAKALGINRASATELVNHLEQRGAVERRPGSTRRSYALHLTALGERLQAEFLEATKEVDRVIGAEMTSAELRQLADLLMRAGHSLALARHRNRKSNEG